MNKEGKEFVDNLRWLVRSNEVGPTRTVYAFTQEELDKFFEETVRACAEIADKSYDRGFRPVGGDILNRFGITEKS